MKQVGATQQLAADLRTWATSGVPDGIRRSGLTLLIDVIGASVAAADAAELDTLVHHVRQHGHDGFSPVPGRRDRFAALDAALLTGFAGHLESQDNVHRPSQVHPSVAPFAAALPLVARGDVPPVLMLDAFVLGVEVQLRLALASRLAALETGWHLTGQVAPIGAAVTAGLLLDLDDARLTNAIATASSMSLGHGEGPATSSRPFHVGKAASNGLLAATLAFHGFTGSSTALEGPRGWFRTLSTSADLDHLSMDRDSPWNLLDVSSGAPPSDGPPQPLDASEADRKAIVACARKLPDDGADMVRVVRGLPEATDCASLLAAIIPEGS